MPSRILSMPTAMRRLRVASCFAEMTQQIHSFRARGVISDQRPFAVALDSMAFRKSAGSLWTAPSARFGVLMLRIAVQGPNILLLEAVVRLGSMRVPDRPFPAGTNDSFVACTLPYARTSARW